LGGGLGLDEVGGAALLEKAGSDDGPELALRGRVALASSVLKLAANLGDVFLKTADSTLGLARKVLGGDEAGGEKGEEGGLHID
jgi:hypothetical protein